jgi:nucleotide-binding universal stress UspA family protein
MIDIRRILCPIDFSEISRHALDHAVAIAKWYDSVLTALYVIHVVPPPPPVLFPTFPLSSPATEADRQALESRLQAWLAPAGEDRVRTEAVVTEGNIAPSILEEATALPADLIVVGTHGLGGFDRLMLGSVAEKVLRKATCPVMTVPPVVATTAAVPYKRLLCPLDFSESSLSALRFATSLAKESDAHLTLLHVIDVPPDDELLVEQFDAPEFRQFVDDRARRRLEALITADVRVWCQPGTKVAYGKPYQQILETAASEGSDLIVIGVRGRNPLDLRVFGSTTNQVVRRAPCPVVTLKQ